MVSTNSKDGHINAKGHEIIANELVKLLGVYPPQPKVGS